MYSWIALIAGVLVTLSLTALVARGIEVRERRLDSTKNSNQVKSGSSRLIEAAIVAAIVGIVAGLAVPNLLKSRIAANESAVVGQLRSINTAVITYKMRYGVYPPSLEVLGPPTNGVPSPQAAGLLNRELLKRNDLGFSFQYSPASNEIIARPIVGEAELRFAVEKAHQQSSPQDDQRRPEIRR